MMVQCPKCGFSQPKDHFCANCGVDMDKYQPPQKSVGEKIQSNKSLHFAVFALILFLGGYWFYGKIQSDQTSGGEESSLFDRIQNTVTGKKAPEPEEEDLIEEEPEPESIQAARMAKPDLQVAKKETAAPPEPATPVIPKTLKFTFALMSTSYIDQLTSSSQNQSGDVSIYGIEIPENVTSIVADAKSKGQLADLPGGRSGSFTLEQETSLSYYYTNPETNEESGISIDVMPLTFEAGTIQWSVKILANITGTDGSVFTLSTDDLVSTDLTVPLMVLGVLPKTSVSEEDASQYADSPLEALSAAEFLSGDSDVVLIVEPQ